MKRSILIPVIIFTFIVGLLIGVLIGRNSADVILDDNQIVDKEVLYPEKCALPEAFNCMDFEASDTGVVMVIQNNADFDVRDLKLKINFPPDELTCIDSAADSMLVAGEIETFTCAGPLFYGQHKGTVTFDYLNPETGLEHSKSGELIVQVPGGNGPYDVTSPLAEP